MIKFLVSYVLWLWTGVAVAVFRYRDRQASCCLEGLIAIMLWPLLISIEIVNWLR
jgi:hypothetical protein